MTRGVNIDDERAKHYYDLGLPDKEIAAKLDCYKKSVARWRTIRGLPSSSKHGRPRKDGTAMRSNISPRSYGTKLLESKSNLTTVESPVTSRVCDVEHYERTGEIKYVDEEEKIMPSVDTIENAKRMKSELTTLELFEATGSYSDVAKKYLTSKTTAHAHLVHLRKVAEQEQKAEDKGPSLEEIEKFHTDTEPQKLPKVEIQIPLGGLKFSTENTSGEIAGDCAKEGNEEAGRESTYGESVPGPDDHLRISMEEPEGEELYWHPEAEEENDEAAEILGTAITSADVPSELQDEAVDTVLGKISTSTGRYICADCGGQVDAVGIYAQSGLCPSCSAELNKQVEEMESQWTGPGRVKSIEELWKIVESDLEIIHKMYIQQAESEYDKQLVRVMMGGKAC